MTSEQDDTVFPEDEDLDDEDSQDDDEDEEEELLNDDVSLSDDVNSPSTSSPLLLHRHTATPLSNPNPNVTTNNSSSSSAVVTVAVPAPSDHSLPPPSASVTVNATGTTSAVTAVTPVQELQRKPQMDDSRKLFQRLWTDEDEIELLRGFLDYTTARGGVAGSGGGAHHHDTALFYDQIKSKLQLDFNKSQLVEKLRRLKKKYRNVIAKISSGKEFSFKSPHDQATFEISRKIWSNIGTQSVNHDTIDDDDDHNNSNNHNNYSIVRIGNPNLNCSNPNLTTNPTMEAKVDDFNRLTPSKSRKRPRSQTNIQPQTVKVEDKNIGVVGIDGCAVNVVGSNNLNSSGGAGPGGNITGVIEETVRSCLSPVFKELLNGVALGGGSRGFGGGIAAAMSPLSFSFGGFGIPPPVVGFGTGSKGGEGTDDRWRKQQILELEVYLKRVELVQDQIKAMLEELRSTGG